MSGGGQTGFAIIGLAGRFPGASNAGAFWEMIRNGQEAITRFKLDELEDAFDQSTRSDPNFVSARPILEGIEDFDAAFFGMTPREAAMTDPQQRIFLECAHEALEDAGYDPARYQGLIGVFAGSSLNSYMLRHVLDGRAAVDRFTSEFQVGSYTELLGSLHDFVATRVAYKLNLKGPAVAVQSACSTSLLAVAQACQSLAFYQSDMALAGGVSITLPQRRGYLHQEGGMTSADGSCRPFDAKASGTIFGSGAGAVLLKRLEDAIADNDRIYAVIHGYGINNDGSDKAGFTAPSSEGQAGCITSALAMAGFDASTIGYVECHGTATPLGDPIEIAGLTSAFSQMATGLGGTVLGSVKANVGHLDAAAGVTGLIKTALMLANREMPPQVNFTSPNPQLDLATARFDINTKLRSWPVGKAPRRAGVSAFGVGGTNVHLCLEEAPKPATRMETERQQQTLLTFSARDPAALAAMPTRLAEALAPMSDNTGGPDVADVAYTLHKGRREFDHRLAVCAKDLPDAIDRLRSAPATGRKKAQKPFVVMMFPGQGSQYPGMTGWLYRADPGFRANVDAGADILQSITGKDIREQLFGDTPSDPDAFHPIRSTILAQPALFIIEYALARWLQNHGVHADAMIGHSLGELTAACLAGVLTQRDALSLVAARGRLMQEQPGGAMLAVRASAEDIAPLLTPGVDIAGVNAPKLCVVAGAFPDIEAFEAIAAAKGIGCQRLHTSHAFHSRMMEPVVTKLAQHLEGMPLNAPAGRIVSTVTGQWLRADESSSAAYWSRHCREPVLFAKAMQTLLDTAEADGAEPVLIEVGPGLTLSTFAQQGQQRKTIHSVIQLVPVAADRDSEERQIGEGLGALWCAGLDIDLAPFIPAAGARLSLPTYPFQRQRHWIERSAAPAALELPAAIPQPQSEVATMTVETDDSAKIFSAVSDKLSKLLEELSGQSVSTAEYGTAFLSLGFDSLFLGQYAQRLNKDFGTKITFRDLMRDASTIDLLAARVIAAAPKDKLPQVAASAPAAPQAAPITLAPSAPAAAALAQPVPGSFPGGLSATGVSPAGLDTVIRDQLSTMQQVFAAQIAAFASAPAPALQAGAAQPLSAPAPSPASAPAGQEAKASLPPLSATGDDAEPPSRFRMYRPGASGGDEELNDRQRAFIDQLARSYAAKSPRSKATTQANREVLADPRSVSGFRKTWKEMVYPIVCERAKGSRIFDVDGNTYVDVVNGYGQTAFGHSPDFVVDAIREQLSLGYAIGPQTPLAGEVAAMISCMTGNERVTFCNTGSEAVMAAMRVARAVTGRDRVVVFGGAYHGQFDEVLIKGRPRKAAAGAAPIASGIPRDNVGNMIVLPYADAESLAWVRSQSDTLAAVVVEPVQSRHPDLQPRDFLMELRRITEDAGAALVFDEVVTGFRVHPGGMQAYFGIRADLATYGKVVGGGMPIGVLAGKKAFMDALDGGHWQFGDDSEPEVAPTFFAGTFVRHPLVLAAAKAVLQHIESDPVTLYDTVQKRTAGIAAKVNAKFASLGLPAKAEHFASWFYVDPSVLGSMASLLFPQMRLMGLHIHEGFPCFLTTAHDEADCAFIADTFCGAIDILHQAGLLRGADSDAVQAPTATLARPASQHKAPLTEPQVEIYLAAQMGDAASCAFNESVSILFNGPLDVSRLRQSIGDLAQRHDALRVRIADVGTSMTVMTPFSLNLPEIDLSSEANPASALAGFTAQDARTPFDLAEGPLARAHLIKLAPERHVLVFTAHHIICDGWSMNILIGDLSELYNARVEGRAPDLQPAQSFLAHAEGKSAVKSSEAAAFWQKQYETLPDPMELPLDKARPSIKSFNGATYRGSIGKELLDQAKGLAKTRGVSLFSVLFTAAQSTMARLSGQQDVVLTVPMGGQALLEEQELVGHCVNFLPMRAPIASNATFASHLADANGRLLEAFDHQDYTFGTLVKERGVPRIPNRTPLSDVQFNLEKIGGRMSFKGLETEVRTNAKAFVNFDLFFNMVERGDGIGVEVDYSTDIFDEATVARFIENLQALLADVCRQPERPIAQAEVLAADERRSALEAGTRAATPFPDNKRIETLIEEQCGRTPNAIAIQAGVAKLTYRELDRAANRLARRLQRSVAEPRSRIALALPRGTGLVVAMLAVLKAGHAYVPLDPGQPVDRLVTTIRLAEAAAVLVAGETPLAGVKGIPALIDLSQEKADKAKDSDSRPAVIGEATDTAYVIFTSGSTGHPKGVAISHRAAVNFLTSMANRPGLSMEDTVVAMTTVSFDIAVLELLLPLTVGARVVVAEKETLADPQALVALIRSSEASLVQATPSMWRVLADFGFVPGAGTKALSGGEPLPHDLAKTLVSGGAELWNMYGPTETTIWSSVARITDPKAPIGIGEPIANTSLHILDDNGQSCPFGVAGELHIGGAGLAQGYFKRPDLTEHAFVMASLPGLKSERLYKTGDLAKRLSDGTLVLLGRRDNQVKIRGFRVELEEIEIVLRGFPGIADAAVAVRNPASMHATILAAYTVKPSETVDEAALQSHARKRLPDYMTPGEWHRVDALPRTANAKLDRKTLLTLEVKAMAAPARATAPVLTMACSNDNPALGETEAAIAAVWKDVLGLLPDADMGKRLFELGANSLHIFRMAARFSERKIAIEARHLMRNPGIKELVALVGSGEGAAKERKAAPALADFRRSLRRRDSAS